MKIQATCNTCGRRFLLSQIGPESDTPGRCPFCGTRFASQYSTILVDSVRDAEVAAAAFVRGLGRLQGMETGFELDIEGLLTAVEEQVRENEAGRAS